MFWHASVRFLAVTEKLHSKVEAGMTCLSLIIGIKSVAVPLLPGNNADIAGIRNTRRTLAYWIAS